MKEKRNCSMPYPTYQPMPMMQAPPMMMPPTYQTGYNQGYTNNSITSNTLEQQMNNLLQQINNLESRITKLESMYQTPNNTTNNYNDSNYYMV